MKKEKEPIQVKRMCSNEQGGMLGLLAVVSQIGLLEDNLGKRISGLPGGLRLLHSGRGMLTRLANDLTHTMPPEQQKHMRRQLPALKMIVGIKAQMPRDADYEHGRWLSFKELDVVATAIRECCRVCSVEDPQEQKKCMFCKLLEVLPTDKADEDARGCGYFSIW